MMSSAPHAPALPSIKNDQGQPVSEQDVLAAMTNDRGYEAFDLARRVSLSTTQVRTLLEPLITAGRVIVRHGYKGCSRDGRLRYYRNATLPGPNAPISMAASALSARDEAERHLLAAMSPGIGYSAAALGHALHLSVPRVTSLMPALIEDGKIAALLKMTGERNGKPRYLYYLAGTQPHRPTPIKTEPTAAPPAGSIFARPTYDAEYGRTLAQHRDLCNAHRGRST